METQAFLQRTSNIAQILICLMLFLKLHRYEKKKLKAIFVTVYCVSFGCGQKAIPYFDISSFFERMERDILLFNHEF